IKNVVLDLSCNTGGAVDSAIYTLAAFLGTAPISVEDPHVTLLGQRSAGGACSVTHISTAAGSILRLSSSNKMSYLRNGSFYDIDQGVEPDFFISKLSNYYDRQSLAAYLNELK
ncbi:MAG: hypothetical protein J6Z38_00775, partial [Lachnospiraceae bacterium]|nr:hypothetical protein [Lachnospiraceae bacterium]